MEAGADVLLADNLGKLISDLFDIELCPSLLLTVLVVYN